MAPRKKKTSRQKFALETPVIEFHGVDMQPNHHRTIGSFSTILTVDMIKTETGFVPIWRASASVILPEDMRVKVGETEIPMKTVADWEEDEWLAVITHCEQMLSGVGEGETLWTGDLFSCNLYLGLSDADILSIKL